MFTPTEIKLFSLGINERQRRFYARFLSRLKNVYVIDSWRFVLPSSKEIHKWKENPHKSN